jgi:hypothetical protein
VKVTYRKEGRGFKAGSETVTVSDTEASDVGVSPWLKRKILRDMAEAGLIALNRQGRAGILPNVLIFLNVLHKILI